MLLEQGWLVGARRVPHHITIAAWMTKHPPCWWCTILACRQAVWRSVDRRIIHWNY